MLLFQYPRLGSSFCAVTSPVSATLTLEFQYPRLGSSFCASRRPL